MKFFANKVTINYFLKIFHLRFLTGPWCVSVVKKSCFLKYLFSKNLQKSQKKILRRILSWWNCRSQSITLLKNGLHLSCVPMNFSRFFRQAIVQHTFKRHHLEDSLALYETAEAKYFHKCLKQDADVILTPLTPHHTSCLFQYPLKV